ncbi:MAG: SWF/SNF helicase family protein, partial [Proteobacteria bacterium]|nr:SWF/SNF helicase family protein [Pseudomonadota bacterium]
EDWESLMRHFLIRRTRTFIKNNYAKTDAETGRQYLEFPDGRRSYFPDRKPHTAKFTIDAHSQYAKLYSDDMIGKDKQFPGLIDQLKLPRYGLSKYIDKNKQTLPNDVQTLANLSKAGKRLMGFCLSTFGKRMDSCGYAYLLTLKRHLLRNLVYIYAIEQKQPLPIGDTNDIGKFYDETIDDEDGENNEQNFSLDAVSAREEFEAIAKSYYCNLYEANPNNIDWLDSGYFKSSLKKDLKADCEILWKILEKCGDWDSSQDPKIKELYRLLTRKHPKDKVLVFTQYADTAEYLCRELQKRGIEDVACVTGNSDNISETVYRFSPNSNSQFKPKRGQVVSPIRILIATDVLSEGQNLQDAHVIMNFDMPWAIIRLIQRAGRVDRIGQNAKTIDCYSFFPADGIEKVIKLRQRLESRIRENAEVLGADEKFFEGNEINLKDLYNEKSGILDDKDDDNDVDTASLAYQIWKNATEANPELVNIIQRMGDVSYSTKVAKDGKTGVITYVRTYNNIDVLTWMSDQKDEE